MIPMRRREFVTLLGGAVLGWPLAARAQQLRKVPRMGVLLAGTPTSFSPRAKALIEGLRDLGYVEGKTIESSGNGEWIGTSGSLSSPPNSLDFLLT